jgi:hypothetical protein
MQALVLYDTLHCQQSWGAFLALLFLVTLAATVKVAEKRHFDPQSFPSV